MKLSLTGPARSLSGTAALLAAALGLSLLGPHRAFSAPRLAAPSDGDLGVTLLSPDPHTPLSGLKPVEISAFYQGTPGNQIVSVELYLDGAKAATKTLDVPETRGVVSFLVDASQLSPGAHRIVVRATAADQEVKSAKGGFLFTADRGDGAALGNGSLGGPALSLPAAPGSALDEAPTLRLVNPSTDGRVQGVVTLRVQAHDASGKAPFVSLFVDKTFKTLRNFAPYEFEWDTTAYPNGMHTIEVYGYNDSAHVGHAPALRLYVNNPGGETLIRHDLLDGVKAVKPLRVTHRALRRARVAPLIARTDARAAARPAAPRKALGRPLPLRRPDVFSALDAPRLAAIHPARPASAREIVRELTAGAGALRLGPAGFAADLSAPFVAPIGPDAAPTKAAPVADSPTPDAPMAGPAVARAVIRTPMSGFRAMPGALPAPVAPARAVRRVDPMGAALAETPARPAKAEGRMARLERTPGHALLALHLPVADLSSPFLVAPAVHAAPRVGVLAARPARHAATVGAAAIGADLTRHPLRVHLPASLGSLLRAAGQNSLIVNHVVVQIDRPLSAQGGVLFGPLRQIFEQGGGQLRWESRTGTVHAKSAGKDIVLTIGRSQALVNAREVVLDGKPYLLTGRTMVPLSFVSEAMDADVQFDAATGHLVVTSRK